MACCLTATTIGIGCHSGGSNSDRDGDNALAPDAAADASSDAASDTASGDLPPGDGAQDGVPVDVDDTADADGGVDGVVAGDASAPVCAGLGKVEDPRGCSGAHICDGAGNCVSRFTVFPIARLTPVSTAYLNQITAGRDGNLWFIDGSTIGRMTPSGDNEEFMIPGLGFSLAAGPDGNLWFTDESNHLIGWVTPAGVQRELPRLAGLPSDPSGIVAGPDGNLWFADFDHIGKITPTGTVVEYLVPTSDAYATSITLGADGNLWFAEQIGNIGRITPSGVVTEFPTVATITPKSSVLYGIAAGADGNLWFTEPMQNQIGRITPTGVVTEFPVPTANGRPDNITAGPDGNVWFVERIGEVVGRITPSGTITEFPVPTPSTFPSAITTGPDGALWFTEQEIPASNGGQHGWIVRMQL